MTLPAVCLVHECERVVCPEAADQIGLFFHKAAVAFLALTQGSFRCVLCRYIDDLRDEALRVAGVVSHRADDHICPKYAPVLADVSFLESEVLVKACKQFACVLLGDLQAVGVGDVEKRHRLEFLVGVPEKAAGLWIGTVELPVGGDDDDCRRRVFKQQPEVLRVQKLRECVARRARTGLFQVGCGSEHGL